VNQYRKRACVYEYLVNSRVAGDTEAIVGPRFV
jgi:hypothetical protein